MQCDDSLRCDLGVESVPRTPAEIIHAGREPFVVECRKGPGLLRHRGEPLLEQTVRIVAHHHVQRAGRTGGPHGIVPALLVTHQLPPGVPAQAGTKVPVQQGQEEGVRTVLLDLQ